MMKHVVCVLLFAGAAAIANAQSCTTAICTAAGVTEAQFLAALPASGNTNATVVVNIPSGSSTWTTGFVYTIPTAVTNLTIQGATTVTFTGTPGAASYTVPTFADNTVIIDGATGATPLQNYVTQGTGQHFRITGLTINDGSGGANSKYGEILLDGNSANFRMDHMHFIAPSNAGADIRVESEVYGVLDHNYSDHGNNTMQTNSFQVFSGNDTIGLGDGEFAQATPWGTASAVYLEANYFRGGASNDCYQGGYFVERYNTIDSAYVGIQTHGTKSTGGPYRACRGYEAYHNYFSNTQTTSTPASGSTGAKGATFLMWGNITSQQAAYRFVEMSGDRASGDECETNTPNGWGYCGTDSYCGSGGASIGSPWDGNSSTVTGYACLDGLGRGRSDALNGAVFPSRVDSVTGTITWPHQKLEPIYAWMNTLNSSGVGNNGTAAQEILVQDPVTNANRDYYYDCGSGNTDGCSGSFTGASGTGFGLLSARPSSCAAGPGGTYGSSPTGSYGVAYWATDANSGNGELYVCTASGSPGTWTGIYQPYTYPHPLISSLTSTSTALTASNFTPVAGTNITLTASLTPSSGPTGTVTIFDGGSSIGTCTLSAATCPFTVTAITAGSHTYTATYGGSGSFASSTSSPVIVTTPAPTTFPLSVTKSGTGGGTVTSSPSGISCGSTCSANFNSGTAVTLTATPDGSSTFGGWSGACSGIGTCSVTVSSSISATATFTTTPPSGPVTFSPPSGTYAGPVNVALSSASPLIFYTRNSSAPNPASTQYASPIAISSATTLQAIAAAGGSVRRNTQATASLWKICTPLGGGPGTPTSVMCGGVGSNQPAGWTITYGTTESISLTGTTGTPQILVTLGGSGCDSCTEETMDKWVKPLNALGHVQNHEMDAWHNDGAHNRLHMGGLQCNQQPGKLNWQVDNEQGSWQNTNITDSCPLSTTLWTHVIFHTHWIIGDTGCGGLGCTFYDYLEVCQASSPAVGCVPNHHVINMQLESDNPGWSAGCADQDQVDLNPGSTTSNPFTGGVLVQANNVTCAFGVTATSSANYSFTTLNPIINFSGHIQLSGQIHPQ